MISNVSSSSSLPAVTPDRSQAASSGTTLVHTPFGDVQVEEQSTPDFSALFTPEATAASPAQQPASAPASTAPATPTMESLFGSQPWLSDPGGTGPGGTKWDYNPIYFATEATADKVASMIGGTVVQKDDILTSGPFQQTAPNELIQFADGRTVNAGLVASLFSHGYPQSYVDAQLNAITDGEQI